MTQSGSEINRDVTKGRADFDPARHTQRLELLSFGLAAFAFCLLVRLSTLGELAFWLDEVYTSDALSLDWGDLVRERLNAGHSPIYFGLMKAFGLAGASEYALRVPSAIFDSFAGAFFVTISRMFSGRTGGISMIVLYAFTPLLINYGQDARPWALLLFFVGLATLGYAALISGSCLAAAVNTHRRSELGAFAAATTGCIGAGLTVTAGAITVIILQMAVLLVPSLRRNRGLFRLWLAHTATTWLVVGPMMLMLAESLRQAQNNNWTAKYAPLDITTIWELAQSLYLLTNNLDPIQLVPGDGAIIPAMLFLGLAAVSLGYHYFRPEIQFIAFVAITIPIVLVAISTIQSVLIPRYFLTSLPFLQLLMSDGAAQVVRWRSTIGGSIIAMGLAGVIVQGVRSLTSERKYDIRPVAEFIKQNSSGTVRDVFVIAGRFGQRPDSLVNDLHFAKILDYYLDDSFLVNYTPLMPGAILPISAEMRSISVKWLISRVQFNTDNNLKLGKITCQWDYRDMRIIVAAQNKDVLPWRLKSCASYNGSVDFTILGHR